MRLSELSLAELDLEMVQLDVFRGAGEAAEEIAQQIVAAGSQQPAQGASLSDENPAGVFAAR